MLFLKNNSIKKISLFGSIINIYPLIKLLRMLYKKNNFNLIKILPYSIEERLLFNIIKYGQFIQM